jgi:hypothetical protein
MLGCSAAGAPAACALAGAAVDASTGHWAAGPWAHAMQRLGSGQSAEAKMMDEAIGAVNQALLSNKAHLLSQQHPQVFSPASAGCSDSIPRY